MHSINLKEKFVLIDKYWTPKIVAELNGQYVKIAKVKGEFVRHSHEWEDELFYVFHGLLIIEMDGKEVHVNEGEFFIVPKGTVHRPVAKEETHLVMFEPVSTAHTGGVRSELTVDNPEWI